MRRTAKRKRSVGVAVHPGKDYGSTKLPFGQDRNSVHQKGDYTVVSVFDGHGPNGHKVSDRVNAMLPRMILGQLLPGLDSSEIQEILRTSFAKCAKKIKNLQSGTTATVAVITPSQIVLANLGDSPALLFTKDGTLLHHTKDHDHENPEEKRRCVWEYYNDDFTGRIGTGLMVSRAFGDRADESAGKLDIPDLYVWPIPLNAYLAVCSDSFAEEIRWKQGHSMILAPNGPTEIAEELHKVLVRKEFNVDHAAKTAVKERVQKFFQKEQGYYEGDNTTLVLMDLSPKKRRNTRKH